MLMPSVDMRDTESNEFQNNFIVCGGLKLLFNIVSSQDFLADGDNNLKRSVNMCIRNMY